MRMTNKLKKQGNLGEIAYWWVTHSNSKEEAIEYLNNLHSTLLQDLTDEMEGKKFKFSKDADTESHGAYFQRGMNAGITTAQDLVRGKIKE